MRVHRKWGKPSAAGRIVAARGVIFLACCCAVASARGDRFPPLPEGVFGAGPFAWPTDNRALFEDLASYHTRYDGNPGLGLPGYTRGCGSRFHEGIDIAPARAARSRRRVTLSTTDCDTGEALRLSFPVWHPLDNVYAVCAGRVAFVLDDPRQSNYGRYIVLEHEAPDGTPFVTLYAHLGEIAVTVGETVAAGRRLAAMGATSNQAGMRDWLAAFPHLHFEIGRVLQRTLSLPPGARPPVGGIYNGRNIEGYDPLEFLLRALGPPGGEGAAVGQENPGPSSG